MSNQSFYGSDKDAREREKRLRKEARRRHVKDARTLGPVRYGDTGAITTEKELTNGGS